MNSPGWFVRLLQDPWFQNELRCRYEDFRTTSLNIDSIFDYIDQSTLYLEEAQQRHYSKWPILGADTGAPEVDPPALTYEEEIERLKNWITLRLSWLDENIPGNCELIDEIAEETSIESLKLYPNPAKEYIFLDFPGIHLIEIKIFDLQGKVISIQENRSQFTRIDLSNMTSGLYIIQSIDDSGTVYSQKFQIEE